MRFKPPPPSLTFITMFTCLVGTAMMLRSSRVLETYSRSADNFSAQVGSSYCRTYFGWSFSNLFVNGYHSSPMGPRGRAKRKGIFLLRVSAVPVISAGVGPAIKPYAYSVEIGWGIISTLPFIFGIVWILYHIREPQRQDRPLTEKQSQNDGGDNA